ncbi:hypothetical protein [Leifsonia sp. 2MCAF36]|uniref:hypothetical protein n=1 Tax=Leifsonia sp. 2MCAF36 TaxID=3232988 RepID=UPI003F96F35E
MNYRSLHELDDAQQRESQTARLRIELAEEYVAYYRSRIHLVQESSYELSARHSTQDDPDFRTELQHVSDLTDQNTRPAGQRIAALEEDYHAMTARHSQEQEDFIEAQRNNE